MTIAPGAEKLYVQYGCGLVAPSGWLNYDASPTLRWERSPLLGRFYNRNAKRFPAAVHYGDVVRGLPLPDRSCDGVYASHILEHLALTDCEMALRETHRLLKSSGFFRVLVPDLAYIAKTYLALAEAGDPDSSRYFAYATDLGQFHRSRGWRSLLHTQFGNSRHRWMWDAASLTRALERNGFGSVRPCSFGDCSDPMFAKVEDQERFHNAVALEAIA